MNIFQRTCEAFKGSVIDATQVARNLFPMIIAIVIFIKILQELSLLQYLAMPFEPVMELMGLPAELGIVWVSAMLMGIYSSVALVPSVMATLPPLTVADATVLGLVILIAHGLILETKLAGQCGLSMRFQLILRLVIAVISGYILHIVCEHFQLGQGQATIFLLTQDTKTLGGWALGELMNLGQIFCFMILVMGFNRALNYFNISYFCGKILRPLFRLLGLSESATNVMIIGIFLGILYGGGIIIKEVREGRLSDEDNFASMSFMSIAHALVEDTILLMLIGGSLWGLLFMRLIVALLVGIAINVLYTKRKLATA